MDVAAVRERLLRQLQVQIAIYFGRDGGLAALQDGVHRLVSGEPVKCLECGGAIWLPTGGHREECRLVREYREVFLPEKEEATDE